MVVLSGCQGPGWFSAITCNIWLRLEYRPLDSAWFFTTQLWYFQSRGHFWTLDTKFGPRLGRGLFSAQTGTRKNMILWKNWCPIGFHRDLCEGNGLYGTQEAFGQAHCPPNLTRKSIYGVFPISRKNAWAPLALGPWWVPYWPFKEAIVYFATRSPAGVLVVP